MEAQFLVYIFFCLLLVSAFIVWVFVDRKIENSLSSVKDNQNMIIEALNEMKISLNSITSAKDNGNSTSGTITLWDSREFLEVLSKKANNLIREGVNPNAIKYEMENDINSFQLKTGDNIQFVYTPLIQAGNFEITDTPNRIQYFRVQRPNQVRLLNAKIDKVTIGGINLYKPDPGGYKHENQAVAKALRHLANIIESSPVCLSDMDNYQLP